MSLGPAEVKNIAHLARLAIDEDLIPDYAKNLTDILGLVEQMSAVDTTGVEPLLNVLDATARLRPDAVTETDQRELFQSIAPAVEDGLYLVPRVIE